MEKQNLIYLINNLMEDFDPYEYDDMSSEFNMLEYIEETLDNEPKAIKDFCNMVLDEKDENMQSAQVREVVTNISDHTKVVIDFVAQLSEMSKFEGINPSFTFIEVNVSELMASYRREAMNFTKPDVAVRVTTDLSPHCRAIIDTNLMHQLMMHLLKKVVR